MEPELLPGQPRRSRRLRGLSRKGVILVAARATHQRAPRTAAKIMLFTASSTLAGCPKFQSALQSCGKFRLRNPLCLPMALTENGGMQRRRPSRRWIGLALLVFGAFDAMAWIVLAGVVGFRATGERLVR